MSSAPYKLAGLRREDLDRLYPTDITGDHLTPQTTGRGPYTDGVYLQDNPHEEGKSGGPTSGRGDARRASRVDGARRPNAGLRATRALLAGVGTAAIAGGLAILPWWILVLDGTALGGAWYALFRWYSRKGAI